jgi:hypothetical protein
MVRAVPIKKQRYCWRVNPLRHHKKSIVRERNGADARRMKYDGFHVNHQKNENKVQKFINYYLRV